MTEPYDYDENTDDGNDDGSDERYVQLTRQQIRAMERDAKQARKAQEELAGMKRELALTRAGIGDLTERQQKALLATIDGDVTAETARAAAEELGFVQPVAAAENDDAAAMNRMAQAAAGATDPNSEDSVARLERADREGGKEALLAQMRADGSLVG